MNPIEAYIRYSAAQHGIDPDIAVRVAMSEGGLNNPVRQSDYSKGAYREPSYGPFQLLIGGPGTGFGGGLGNRALAAGIDPRDPKQWQKAVDFALAEAGKRGWGQWYGAKRVGIGNYQGIGEFQGKVPDIPDDMVWDDKGLYHAGNPPGGTVPDTTGGAAGNTATNPYPMVPMKDKREGFGDIFADMAAGMGGSGGGVTMGRGGQAPQLPQAPLTPLGAIPTIDPQQAEAQRQELALAMQRLNSGRLWG